MLVLLRGAPGVGKTMVGAQLMRLLPGGAVCEVDRFRAMLADVDWSSRAQHAVGMRAAIAAARSLLDDGVAPVVVIDTFGRDSLSRVAVSLDAVGVKALAVSLWAEERVLFERLDARAAGYQDREVVALMNEDVRTRRLAGDCLVDTTALGPADVAAAVVEAIRRGGAMGGDASGAVPHA